jgi:hypothetical protein
MRLVTTLCFSLAIVVPACQGEQSASDDLVVETEANPAVDFTTYTRFAVIDPVELLYEESPGPYEKGRLELLAAIEEEMTGVGLFPDDDAPQLVVSTYVAVEPSEDFIAGYFGYYWGYDFSWASQQDHEVGTLVIDVVEVGVPGDFADDVLVFRGVVRGARGNSSEALEKLLRRAIIEVFEDWPV